MLGDPGTGVAASASFLSETGILKPTPLMLRYRPYTTEVMDGKKPASVRLFDCLFWLSVVLIILNNLFRATSYSKEVFLTVSLRVAVMQIGAAGALWYFASIRRSFIALVLIIIAVAFRILLFYRMLPEAAWFSQSWLISNIGPQLLLVVAVGSMMTSSARSWRRRKGERLSDVFE